MPKATIPQGSPERLTNAVNKADGLWYCRGRHVYFGPVPVQPQTWMHRWEEEVLCTDSESRFACRLWAAVVAILLLVVGTAGVVASQAIQPPNIITPKLADQVTNIDVLRSELKNYYGTPGAATGSGATAGWTLALKMDSNYAAEAEGVAARATRWLNSQASGGKSTAGKAIVLDVDDATLTTWNYELYSNWDYNPVSNATFVGITSGFHRQHVPGHAGHGRDAQPCPRTWAMPSSSSPVAAIHSTLQRSRTW